jgi:hypothetical protein
VLSVNVAVAAWHYTTLRYSSSRRFNDAGWSWLVCLAFDSSDFCADSVAQKILHCGPCRFHAYSSDHLEAGFAFNFKTNDTTRSDCVGLDWTDLDESFTADDYCHPSDRVPYSTNGNERDALVY